MGKYILKVDTESSYGRAKTKYVYNSREEAEEALERMEFREKFGHNDCGPVEYIRSSAIYPDDGSVDPKLNIDIKGY